MTTTSPSEKTLLTGASVPGAAHAAQGRPNQDALRLRRYGFGCVAAAADGVGSQRWAEWGSRAAVRAVHAVFRAYARGDVERPQITRAIGARYAALLKPRFRAEADTTCIFLAHLYNKGLFLGQVGDGALCGYINGVPFSLGEKEDGFTNLVVPLSADREAPATVWRARFIPQNKLQSVELMLATDGVSEDLLPGREGAFARYLLDRAGACRTLREQAGAVRRVLEAWETPMSRDDKTIGLYRWTAGPGGGR